MARRINKNSPEGLKKRLDVLLKAPENQICADCFMKQPRWASSKLGVFMCIDCSGIHRNLGTHISFVRSVNLDSWTVEQVEMMEAWGNERARAYYEAEVPPSYNRPREGAGVREVQKWIRDKYEFKRFIPQDGSIPQKGQAQAVQPKKPTPAPPPAQAAPPQAQKPPPAPVQKAPPAPAPDLLDFSAPAPPPQSVVQQQAQQQSQAPIDPFQQNWNQPPPQQQAPQVQQQSQAPIDPFQQNWNQPPPQQQFQQPMQGQQQQQFQQPMQGQQQQQFQQPMQGQQQQQFQQPMQGQQQDHSAMSNNIMSMFNAPQQNNRMQGLPPPNVMMSPQQQHMQQQHMQQQHMQQQHMQQQQMHMQQQRPQQQQFGQYGANFNM
jgi:stromal membrane-associated protein